MPDIRALWMARSPRGEYWLCILGLFALNLVLGFAIHNRPLASLLTFPVWLFIAARRLHDFNRGWWWGLIPFAAGFILGFARGAYRSAGEAFPLSDTAYALSNGLITLTAMVVIGAWPGDQNANRFGGGKADPATTFD